MVKGMKRLRKVFILVCAFLSNLIIASTTVHADLISKAHNTPVGMDVIIDPVDTFKALLPDILLLLGIVIVVLVLTALLVAKLINKKKKDNNKKDDEIK